MSRAKEEGFGSDWLDPRLKSTCLAALLLLNTGFIVVILPVKTNSNPQIPRTMKEASMDTINFAGLAPTTISLSWTESTDPTFLKYVLRESTISSNGPYETIANIGTRGVNYYYDSGLTPSTTEWWQEYEYNMTGFRVSNTLQVAQPPAASLSYSQPMSTSVQLGWNNNAHYGGLVSFNSYQLMASKNLGTYSVAATITDVSLHSYTVTGLTPSTSYRFYLNTTDQCKICSSASMSSSSSPIINFQTPNPLASTVVAHPTAVDVGQHVFFSCSATGGTPPYNYSWTFGDGNTGTGADANHFYKTPGTMNVLCNVTDHAGESASAEVRVTVGTQRTLGLPLAMGLAIVLSVVAGIVALVALLVARSFRRKKHKVNRK